MSSSSSCGVCLFLTQAEVDEFIASGGTVLGGPFPSEGECQANCCGAGSGCPPECATSMSLTVDGIFDVNCNVCTAANGMWTLTGPTEGPIPGDCSWSSDLIDTCVGEQQNPAWMVVWNPITGVAQLWIMATDVGAYWQCADFDCTPDAINVFTLLPDPDTFDCDGWPASITVTNA